MNKQKEYRRKTFGISNYRKQQEKKERNRRLIGLVAGIGMITIVILIFVYGAK
jgi:hypothetical protein